VDYGSVPLALMCRTFGQFEDYFQSTPESQLSPKIFQATRKLASEMARLYTTEIDRQRHFASWLMETYNMPLHTIRDDFSSDAHCEHPEDGEDGNRFLIMVTEGRLEVGDASADVHVQGLMYYRTFYREFSESHLLGRGCLPEILLIYEGALTCCGWGTTISS
jgi:hypothetical protein